MQPLCSGKAIRIAYSECVDVALIIQHVMLVHHIVLSSVACRALQHFFILFRQLHDFREAGY